MPLAWRETPPRIPRDKNTLRPFLAGEAFTFNNETRVSPGWNEAAARKLWLYNLHYMSWLFDIDSPESREAWIERWILENPRAAGGTGWEPYPVSLRLFNWSKHYALSGRVPGERVLESLAEHSGWLLENLEFHLDGNHLLENLLALTHAGLFWDAADARGAEALRKVRRLLGESLKEQFLPDGGHYELSPMYHAILLERLLDLLNVWPEARDPFPGLRAVLEHHARAGLDWLDVMSVDGLFALFNDAAYDTAPNAGKLLEYGARLLGWTSPGRTPLRSLPASGYYRAEAGPFTLIFDAGKLGPDRQMGHAQGDLLSFCLWVNDVPVITHPGNHEYVGGEMRAYCRSTASHNTFAPIGAEQAEWWGSHRVGRRARPLEAGGEVHEGEVRLWGAHDGYSGLPGKPIHRREMEMTRSRLVLRDRLTPSRASLAYFHVHPDCLLEPEAEGIRIRLAGGTLHLKSAYPVEVGDSWYCPEFGVKTRNRVIIVPAGGGVATTELSWEPTLAP